MIGNDMSKTLDVDEKTAEILSKLAAANGVSIEQLLAAHIPGLNRSNGNETGVKDALSTLDEWVESFSQDTPPLTDDAVGRASIYGD